VSSRPSFSAPFGERSRTGKRDGPLVSRGLVVDAAPQQRARQALRAAERLSRAVVEGLEEGVVVLDPALRPVSWNASALRILGLGAGDMIGQPAGGGFLFASGHLRYDNGKPLSAQDNPAKRALRQGAPVRATLRRSTPDGGDRSITILARPIGGAHGTSRRGVVATVADVTSSVESAQRLREERDRAQRYLEVASTLVVVLDPDGRVELVNRQGCELLGFAEHELVGRDWHATVIPPGDRREACADFERLLAGEQPPPERAETFLLTKSGEERKIAWRNAVVRDADGTVTSVLSSGEDVTERRRAEAQVAYLAHHDRLTGLPNRALLEEQLQRDLARARRTGGSVALVQLGLDNFKLVNDSLGHGAGDAVLRETAQRLAGLTRAGDVIARQGGDEFMLLLDCGAEDAQVVAQLAGDRVMAALERPFVVAGAEFHIGASIGIALFPRHANNAESLFKHAGMAMHQGKQGGGGAVVFYERGANEARDRLALTSRLRRAIECDELRLHFQPIYRVQDGTLVAVEALVRWEDPVHGLVPPAGFIPVAEETGLIEGIGSWVVEALCRQASRWAKEGFRPRLCFNLSPRQLRQPDLVASIAQTIARYELPAGQFCAELTESAVLSDERRDSSLLDELHEAGLTIAIDDFGSGHSSLARLRDLPVQVLKVDRSFLKRVPEDPGSTAIVAAVLELGTALGMTTVVEGVEDAAQLALLRQHGAPLAQGFLLGRPVPAEQLDRSPARVTG
jgi:diguanylate cyclase (GGDEF)-like protein/PAS domain S-box-containing protein